MQNAAGGPFADFDIHALYEALDAKRAARGMSWQQVAREMGSRSGSTPGRSLSSSTLSGIRKRRALEGDGVLQMLQWLGRTPESFVPGRPEVEAESSALPAPRTGGILRFDCRAIYLALDAQRRERGLTWREAAREMGVPNPAALTHLSKGGRTGFPQVMRILRWLRRPAVSFTRISN